VPHTRKGAGGTRGCPCARARGHLRREHLRECPCARAPTAVTSPVPVVPVDPLTGWIDSVVQIQTTIVFLGTHGEELLLHLAEHGLMKLVPIYMF
jgi:hypothetical protein